MCWRTSRYHLSPRLRAVMECGDIVARIWKTRGIPINDVTLERWFCGCNPMLGRDWSASSWDCWFCARLSSNDLSKGYGTVDDSKSPVTAILHVFFIYLEETAEMLSRLDDEPEVKPPKVTRSKLGPNEPRLVRPIDRVAHRVGPTAPTKRAKS